MKLKTLLGERVMIIPDNTDEITPGGIIIPESANSIKHNVRSGVITKKGVGLPWNRMEDIHVKDRIFFKRGSGAPYEEESDGHTASYLILTYQEILLT